jgi:curved DNA-binding protein CbpA
MHVVILQGEARVAERTLYDFLELSSTASPEAIRVSYERLAAKFDPSRPENAGNSAAKVQYDVVKEAFQTLSDPDRRKQYDAKLIRARTAVQTMEIIEPFWTLPKMVLVCAALLVAGGFYYSEKKEQARQARMETERHIAAAKAAEAKENARIELEKMRLEETQKKQEQIAEERFKREGEYLSRKISAEQQMLSRRAEQEKAQAEAASRRAESQRRAEELQAENAARQQLARDKAELCRLERERYGKAISC